MEVGIGNGSIFCSVLENNKLKTIGKVINLENEKNNLLVIELLKNQKEVLIPFVKEIVPLVDIKNNFSNN